MRQFNRFAADKINNKFNSSHVYTHLFSSMCVYIRLKNKKKKRVKLSAKQFKATVSTK